MTSPLCCRSGASKTLGIKFLFRVRRKKESRNARNKMASQVSSRDGLENRRPCPLGRRTAIQRYRRKPRHCRAIQAGGDRPIPRHRRAARLRRDQRALPLRPKPTALAWGFASVAQSLNRMAGVDGSLAPLDVVQRFSSPCPPRSRTMDDHSTVSVPQTTHSTCPGTRARSSMGRE